MKRFLLKVILVSLLSKYENKDIQKKEKNHSILLYFKNYELLDCVQMNKFDFMINELNFALL